MTKIPIPFLVKSSALIFSLFLSSSTTALAENENFQINGSFEYASNPDVPDYWVGMGRWSRSACGIPPEMLTEELVNSYSKKFFLDDSVSFEGKRSLKVQAPFFAGGNSMDVIPGKDYVISLYLKSSRDNMMVDISAIYLDREKAYLTQKAAIPTEWKRYELKVPTYPNNKLSVLVKPIDSGELWVDAVQIEEGSKATPFKASNYDQGFTKPQPKIHIGTDSIQEPPSVHLSAPVAGPVNIDGELDDVWKNAATVSMNTMMGSKSETSTHVKLLYDTENIYIAFDCEDPMNIKGKGDSIEIFIDVLGIGSPYYQFIFEPNGKKYNYRSLDGRHEWDWKADWKIAVKEKQKGWTAEVAIPFAAMPEIKELAGLDFLKMNFCRNYSGDPEVHLSWAPVRATFLEPEHFGSVFLAGKTKTSLEIKKALLVSVKPTDYRFNLVFDTANSFNDAKTLTAIVNVESKSNKVQTRVQKITLDPGKDTRLVFKGFRLPDNRCRVGMILTDDAGKIVKQIQEFIDTPQPLKMYPEFSYYTKENTARFKVEYRGDCELKGAILKITSKLAPSPGILAQKDYPFIANKSMIFEYPLKALTKPHTYTIEASLIDTNGKELCRADCELVRRDSNITEAKVNHFNRGIYINGAPYIPYGYQMWLPDDATLKYYKTLGHDYLCYTGHWGDIAANNRMLSTCDRLGLKVMDFHAVRSYADSPGTILPVLKGHPSLIAVTPVDESVDNTVPKILTEAKQANPYLICYKNDNTAGYRFWRSQLDGLCGDAVSIDRYPLIHLAKGRPQTTSLIYSFERALEMLDKDAERERKPVFCWMEAAEAQSKEPTATELTWFHYIAVVNHCMGFTYFGGIPMSRHVREKISELNKELKTIQPFLFSDEDAPQISNNDKSSSGLIRIMTKKLGSQLLLICVNRATETVNARLDLSEALGKNHQFKAQVLFENRIVTINPDLQLCDKFLPLERHVYKINISK